MEIIGNTKLCDGADALRLRLYDCGYAETGSEWCAAVARPPFTRLYYILGGDGWFETPREAQPLRAGYCYLLPGGFSFRHACRTSMRQLYFHIALCQEGGQDVLPALERPLWGRFEAASVESLSALVRGTGHAAAALRARALLMETMAGLFDAHGVTLPRVEHSPCVRRALEYIHWHVTAQITLDAVAAHALVSQTTLSKHFRREVGTSVARYAETLVFARAQQMLRDKTLSIAEISERLGFCDQFYFSRRFSHHFLESPQGYRRKALI
jgi:AraC-like DNA-binding protein